MGEITSLQEQSRVMSFWGGVPGMSDDHIGLTNCIPARLRHTLRTRSKIYPNLSSRPYSDLIL